MEAPRDQKYIMLKLHVCKAGTEEFLLKQRQTASHYFRKHLCSFFDRSCNLLIPKCVTYRLGLWPLITEWLMSLALRYSHLVGLVLTQRLLVQLIAICIALLVSQHCLCDISIFFFFLFSLPLSPLLRLVPCILGRRIRQCLVCD